MRLPSKKRPGNQILAADWNLLIDALQARTPRPSHGMEIVSSSGGFSYRLRQVAGGGELSLPGQPFAEIITWKEGETKKTGIRGGAVYAGDKVWNVEHRELNLDASGSYRVWLEVGVTANVFDDVLFPGLDTSTAPEWKQQSGNGDYGDQEIPEVPSGTGKAVIAIGELNIANGSATLIPASAGSIQIEHCPGSLWHTRILDAGIYEEY
jgi:hypothetical protein